MKRVVFLDTSIVCNLVPVPGFDQDSAEVTEEMSTRMKSGTQFILPITAVIETGNHIAQLPKGDARRKAADRFSTILTMVISNRSPWVLHDIAWNTAFLQSFLDGAETGSSYVQHALNGVGAGDLCILTERQQYQSRSHLAAEIWTLDHGLNAHNS